MPRGKYVNHKGRSRHFTSPEELQQEKDEDSNEEGSSGEGSGNENAAGTSKAKRAESKKNAGTKDADSDDSDESDSDIDDRNARKGVNSLIEIENPNRVVKKGTQKVDTVSSEKKPELTRREREEIEKQKARKRYEKLHAEGKTREAKSDLARLALIRKERAEAAAKREAEKKEEKSSKA